MRAPREAAVAGTFYPGSEGDLASTVGRLLEHAEEKGRESPAVVVAPHAGYVYSGPVAAEAFSAISGRASDVGRIVVVGPSHYVAFAGLATSGAPAFRTPLGDVPVDGGAEARLERLPQVARRPGVHAPEHALEVELPFLQRLVPRFELVPLLVGEAAAEEVAEALDLVCSDASTLLVVSTDLSHFYDYETARAMDLDTCRRVERAREVDSDHACGWRALNGLFVLAEQREWRLCTLDLRNSGDTAGGRDSVVGYGAWIGS